MLTVRKSFSLFCIDVAGRFRAAALGGQIILGRIDGDPVQPRVESRLPTKLGQGTVCLDKGILRHILDFGGVPDQARDQANDLPMVFGHQKFKGPLVALLDAFN
ncbi:hypothetical protein D3C72_1532500 [compost metagenome]